MSLSDKFRKVRYGWSQSIRCFRSRRPFLWTILRKKADIELPKQLYLSRMTSWRIERGAKLRIGERFENDGALSAVVGSSGSLRIGEHVYFNDGAKLSCLGTIEIGDETIFGPDVRLFDNNHVFGPEGVQRVCRPGSIRIGKGCWIASDVTILSGADIGDRCVIGAGCIIKGQIPAGSLVTVEQTQKIRPIVAKKEPAER